MPSLLATREAVIVSSTRIWERGLVDEVERLFLRAVPALKAAGYRLQVLDLDDERAMWEIRIYTLDGHVGLKIAAAVAENVDLDLGALLAAEVRGVIEAGP